MQKYRAHTDHHIQISCTVLLINQKGHDEIKFTFNNSKYVKSRRKNRSNENYYLANCYVMYQSCFSSFWGNVNESEALYLHAECISMCMYNLSLAESLAMALYGTAAVENAAPSGLPYTVRKVSQTSIRNFICKLLYKVQREMSWNELENLHHCQKMGLISLYFRMCLAVRFLKKTFIVPLIKLCIEVENSSQFTSFML